MIADLMRPSVRRLVATSAAAVAVLATGSWAHPVRTDQVRDAQWHLPFLKADQVHALSQGLGVKVAVVDSGVDASHPDLVNSVLPGVDFIQPGGDGRTDLEGHGTGMASLIAARGHGEGNRDGVLGLAPQALILPARIPASGSAQAITWAVNNGAKVINLSLGTTSGVRDAVAYAISQGCVVVIAAGNDSGGPVLGLAKTPGVIVVSGTDRSGSTAAISSQGPEVALAAPAVDIMSARVGGTRYRAATGTSDATALVSAAAALVMARYPELNAASVINRLIRTADDKGPPGRDPQYGFGIVNPLRALTENIPPVETNPLGDPNATAGPSPTVTPTRSPGTAGGGDGTSAALIAALLLAAVALGAAFIVYAVLLARRRSRRS